METRTVPEARLAAAVWVAGTGAFLLVAAAAVFVAARWGDLPEAAKIGIVGALTGAFLIGGRALSRTLPATGDVVFHLGALLLPIDLAALDVRAGLDWRGILLTESLLGVAAFGPLARSSGSVVLRWAAVAAVPALAAGFAAVSPVPAPLLVAGAALAAVFLGGAGSRRPGLALAALAGLAPVLGAATASLLGAEGTGAGVLAELGLSGGTVAGACGLLSGLVAASVLGREAKAAGDVGLAVLAIASVFSGGGAAWVTADLGAESGWLALPAVFLAVEVVALLCREDPFWKWPLAGLAVLTETVAAVPALLVTIGYVLAAPLLEVGFIGGGPLWEPDPAAAVSLATLAAAWILGGTRRTDGYGTGLREALAARAVLAVPAIVAAVALGSASVVATAASLLVCAALVGPTGSRQAGLVAGAAALWAPVVVIWDHPSALFVFGVVGAAVLAESAIAAVRAGRTWLWPASLALAACGASALGASALAPAAAWTVAVGGIWMLSVRFDRADVTPTQLRPSGRDPALGLGDLARVAGIGVASLAASLDPRQALVAVAVATLAALFESVRRGRSGYAWAGAAGVQFVAVDLAHRTGLGGAETGVVLCLAAVVWAGLALVSGDRWRLPLLAAAGSGLAVGLAYSAEQPQLFADCLLITAGLLGAGAATTRRAALGYAAGVVTVVALAVHLDAAAVTVSEPYLAPVVALLLIAGEHSRRTATAPVSSWLAHTPAITLLGGAAMAERLGGGGAGHALFAGVVGVAAVAAGGTWRLAGPLVAGTGLLVAVTAHESLAQLASVPTWAWLAAGGSGLLALGIALERTGATPVEAGRRLVDVIGDRFD